MFIPFTCLGTQCLEIGRRDFSAFGTVVKKVVSRTYMCILLYLMKILYDKREEKQRQYCNVFP